MYRTLFIALASTSVLCGAADAQVAGSVTGRVNATVAQPGIPVDPRTGQPLSRIEIMRAQRAARLARRNAGELIADGEAFAARDPLAQAPLNGEAPPVTGAVDIPQTPAASDFEFDGLPARTPVEVQALAEIPAPQARITPPQPMVTATAPRIAPRAAVTSPAPRQAFEGRTVVYRERTDGAVRREPAPAAARPAAQSMAQPQARSAGQPPVSARAQTVTRTSPNTPGIPDWIIFVLAGLTITGVVVAARRTARRNQAGLSS